MLMMNNQVLPFAAAHGATIMELRVLLVAIVLGPDDGSYYFGFRVLALTK